jgi:hypothetical protein
MESQLALKMTHRLFDKTMGKAHASQMVTDDDATTRSLLSHTHKKGKLRQDVPSITFLADPGHRCKVMLKAIFANVSETKTSQNIRKVDAMRIKKYTSFYIMQHRQGDLKKFVQNARAPIEHLFNEHAYCDASWCWAKDIEEKRSEIIHKRWKKEVNLSFSSN